MTKSMIIPGINNKWGLLPTLDIEGWIQVLENGNRIHWRRDYIEEARRKAEWRDLFPGMTPQTNGDWSYFSECYKEVRL